MTDYRLERLAAEFVDVDGTPSVSSIWWLTAAGSCAATRRRADEDRPLLFGTTRGRGDARQGPPRPDLAGTFVLRYERQAAVLAEGEARVLSADASSEVLAEGRTCVPESKVRGYLDRATVARPANLPALSRISWGRADLDRATVAYASLDFDDGRTWSAGARWPREPAAASGSGDSVVALDLVRCEGLSPRELTLAIHALRALDEAPRAAVSAPADRACAACDSSRFERVPFDAMRGDRRWN